MLCLFFFFFSSRRRDTRYPLVTGVQTCALPISSPSGECSPLLHAGSDPGPRKRRRDRADQRGLRTESLATRDAREARRNLLLHQSRGLLPTRRLQRHRRRESSAATHAQGRRRARTRVVPAFFAWSTS